MADSLSDDFAPASVASSSSSRAGSPVSIIHGSGDESGDGGAQDNVGARPARTTATSGKKRKRREKERQRRAQKAAELVDASLRLATLPPDVQADELRARCRKMARTAKRPRTGPEADARGAGRGRNGQVDLAHMSEMELDEVMVREAMLVDTTSFREPRDIAHFAPFTSQFCTALYAELREASHPARVEPGSPALLIVTPNALRATDLVRALRSVASDIDGGTGRRRDTHSRHANNGKDTDGKTGSKAEPPPRPSSVGAGALTIGKLFGRHFKLSQHVEWLQKHTCALAVGTPQRLLDLAEGRDDEGAALRLDALRYLVLDASWLDAKQRGLLDGDDTRDATLRLLACEAVRARLRGQGGRGDRDKGNQRARVVLF